MDLETRQLQQLLAEAQQLPEVLLLKPVTTSTNDDVREIAQKGIQSVLVCSTRQTQGRGQRQRQWVSPEGNIYLSTLLQTKTPIDALGFRNWVKYLANAEFARPCSASEMAE